MSRWERLSVSALVLLWLVELTWRMWGHAAWFVSGLPIALALLALSWRARSPLRAAAAFVTTVVAAIIVQAALPDPTTQRTEVVVPIVAIVLLSYSLGSRASTAGLVIGAPLLASLVPAVSTLHGVKTASEILSGAAFAAVFFVVIPVGVGLITKSHRTLAQRLGELERLAGTDHQANIGRVRAEAQLAVAAQLRTTLESGLLALVGEQDRQAFEAGARSLLESTRDVVVSLTGSESIPDVTEVAGAAPPERDHRDGWLVIVAAALGLGLLVVSRESWSSPIVAVAIGGALVAALVAVARFPILAVASSWALLEMFDRFAAPIAESFIPLGLYVATLVFAGWLPPIRWTAPCVLGVVVAAYLGGVASGDVVGFVVAGLLALAGGLVLRRHSELVARVRDAHARATHRRASELDKVALGQRLAAAREVHDAVGHRLTVAALQAGAARRLATTDKQQSDEAFGYARSAIEHAYRELEQGFASPPTLRDLIRDAAAAGARVEVIGHEPPSELDDVLVRVAQECLTNALRHAPGATVRVYHRETAGGAQLRVTNGPATRTAPAQPSGGRGLAGIAERVSAAGGSATWGATPDGGFVVDAQLPVREAAATW